MQKLKFRTRLIIGFSIILTISFIISVFAILQIQNISKNTELIYKHPLTVSNAVRDINVNINAIHRSMKDITLAENPSELEGAIKVINSYDSLIYESFDIVKERFLGDTSFINEACKAYTDWETIRNEVITLKKAGKDYEAAKITKGKGATHVALLFEKTKKLTDFAQGKANEFYFNAKEKEEQSTLILAIVIIILLIIGVVTSLFIARSISKPINLFIKELNLIYNKDYYSEKNFQKKSEQDKLLLTVSELKNAYEKLQNFNQELDREVRQRTKELTESEEKLLEQNEEYHILNEMYKTQNKELKFAKEQAEKSERLKSVFLANMSHEIRTPMNSIIGFANLLKREGLSEEKRAQYFDLIDSDGQRLLAIISDIVDISKIDAQQLSLHYETYDLNKIIDNLKNRFSISKTKKAGVTIKSSKALSDKNCLIKTDRSRLLQILSNLLENALKFTDQGIVEFGYTIENENIKFYVKDSGIGIQPKEQQLIFQRFRQAENEYSKAGKGTGLGLSIVKGLVEIFEGEIWLESEVNKGTTFYFTIPYIISEIKIKSFPEKKEKSTKLKNTATILIAEDEFSNSAYLSELLNNKYNLILVNTGEEAIETLNNNKAIDLVLMDIKMPGIGGLEAVREIRKTNKDIPIIAQTAYAMAEDKIRVKIAGCNDYLAKPTSSEDLYKMIKKYINN